MQNSFVSSNRFYNLLGAFLLGIIACVQYSNTFEHEYVLDDVAVIEMNDHVKKGISGIPSILKNYNPKSLQVQNNYGYRPVTLTSFAIDISLFGQNPRYGHIANVLYFSLLCMIIFFTLRLLFPYHSHWLSFLVTLLFAVHPIHTEVVANIKSRDEILCLLFCLLSLQNALQYVDKQSKIHYFLFALCFLLALFSKEQALLFVFIIPITLIILSNISLQKLKNILIVLVLLFALRWFIGLQNNIPLFLSILAIVFCNLLFYFFYKAKIQNLSALKQSSKDSLNIWKQQINKLENYPQLLQTLFVGVFMLGLLAIFFEIQWFIMFLSIVSLSFFGKQKLINQSLLLILTSTFFATYSINNHSSEFLIVSYFMLSWLFVFQKKQYSLPAFASSFLIIAIAILYIIPFPYSIVALSLIFLFVFAFQQRKTIFPTSIIIMALSLLSIFKTFDSNNLINFIIILLLFLNFSFSLFLTYKKTKKHYILTTFIVMLLIGHFEILCNTTSTISANFTAQYKTKSEDILPLSSIVKEAEYGFFIESLDLNNTFLWTDSQAISIATSFYVLGRYLKNFFVPHPLIYFYGYNQIPLVNFTNLQVLLSIFIHILLICFALFYLHRQPTIAYAIIFYLVSISLYSQLFFYVPDTMADRYFFTASLPLSLLTVLLLAKIVCIDFTVQKESIFSYNKKINLSLFMLIFVLVLPAYAHATKQRNSVWKTNLSLFEHDLKYMENCARAHYYYANEMLQTYHLLEDKKRIAIAEKIAYHFSRSIEISDKSFASYLNLIKFYIGHNMFDQAHDILQLFLTSYPDTFHANHLLGYYYFYKKDYTKAVQALEKAYEKAPKNQDNFFFLGWAYYNNGNYEKAVKILEKGIAFYPSYQEYFLALSDIHFGYGNYEKAQKVLEMFIKSYPNAIKCYEKLVYQLTERGEQQAANRYQLFLEQNIKKRN